MKIADIIANELQVKPTQTKAAINLLDNGATVPFVARYRKEITGGLDDGQLRSLETRLTYLRELQERRTAILSSIEKQGLLTEELTNEIDRADSKTRLEDLYLPYKPKRRTKAQIAREAGLDKLLDKILDDDCNDPSALAVRYVDKEKGIDDTSSALSGAKYIFMERAAEQADLVGKLREYVWNNGDISSQVVTANKNQAQKFSDYFDFQEAIAKIPSHRILAIFRGRNDNALRVKIITKNQDDISSADKLGACEAMIANHFNVRLMNQANHQWLFEAIRAAWKIKISMQIETDLFIQLKEQAEMEAIRVFANNLRDLLLTSPAGPRATLGLDPGLRTGVKVVVVDHTGKLVDNTVIFPHPPQKQWDQSIQTLLQLIKKHKVELISIGNGTASRETDKLVNEVLRIHTGPKLTSLVVSEAGASVYSASELAAKEFPDLDVSYRGAVSIARRLQDPLAELVKIEPRSIGVGQYQHDLNQTRLVNSLATVVEDCVNAVGVDLNTASAPLLSHVAGLSESMAANIVDYREQNGTFINRRQLLKVPRLGPKAYEQSAGFLRIMDGENPLDASAVHPEAYPVVNKIIELTRRSLDSIIGDSKFLSSLAANDFQDDTYGEPTVRDIISELDKPGRDPRPEFRTATFREGVEKLADLKPDMILEGVATNVTNFGAFIDIGVHQDGLVHISQLADKFIKDPRDVIKAGDIVRVMVIDVDEQRKRITLTMRGLSQK